MGLANIEFTFGLCFLGCGKVDGTRLTATAAMSLRSVIIFSEKNEGENTEEKAAQRSRSFIPSMNINESGGKRTSLRLGTLPDPVHLRPASTLSIDDLKRRIYRRRAPSSTPTSSTDGVSSPLMIQKTGAGMHTPTGQASDVSSCK